MLPVPYGSYEKFLYTKVNDCSCKFEGLITSTKEEGDFQICVIDNAIEVKVISDRVRGIMLERMEPPIVRDVAGGLVILGLIYFITQITSATLDQTIPLRNLSHRRIFATILLVIFAVHSFLSFRRMTVEHPDKKSYATDHVKEAQDARRSALEDPLSLLKDPENCKYFHDGELLKLIVQAYGKQKQDTEEEKLKCLQNMNSLMMSSSLNNRFKNDPANIWTSFFSEWFKMRIPSSGEIRRLNLATHPAPAFNKEQWDKAAEIFRKISEKAESIKGAAALPQ
jgi:hypothetical protein